MACVVGLTGGIGSGKSKALYIFGKLGARFANADHIAHTVLMKDEVIRIVCEKFGIGILNDISEIDRNKLSELVFSSNENRGFLNSVIHPAVIEEIKSQIEVYRKENPITPFVVEVPLLFEANMQSLFDVTICIVADDEIRIERIKNRDKISDAQAKARISSQMSQDDKIELAIINIFNNSDNLDDLWEIIEPLYNRMVEMAEKEKNDEDKKCKL